MKPSAKNVLFDSAFARHQAGDLASAETLYRQVLASQPGHADSLHLLGLVCAQSGRPDEAVPLMRAAIALRPDFDLALYNLGNVLSRLERLEEAVAAYEAALRLKPNSPAALVNLGAALRSLGRSEAAVEVYRRALALRPSDAAAHYNLGCALQALGRTETAVRAYRRALALKPDDADAWANLAAVLIDLERPSEAIAACRRRVALEPNSAEAYGALAVALLLAGRTDEAVAAARTAADRRPDDADAHIHLGNGLLEQGLVTAAVGAYLRAVALKPDDARAWINLGIALQEAGQGDEAATAIAKALALEPGSAPAWAVHGGLKTFRAGDPDVDVLTGLLGAAERGGSLEDQESLAFTLGKAMMDVGDSDAAFAHLSTGNRLHRAKLRYDVADDIGQMDALARAFDARILSERTDRGNPSDLPVFIVGMPRSGSTLVEQILASHPKVFGAGELTTLERLVIDRLGIEIPPSARARLLADLSDGDLDAMARAYVAGLAALAPGALRVTDKMPANFRLAGLIHRMLPNARIIHCRRDPVDTGFSCYAAKFSRGQDFTYDLGELGAYYRAYEGLMAHWRSLLPADRFTEVVYEEVVDDLEGQARRLIGFCGLEWDDACLAFHSTSRQVRTASVNQVRRPLYRSSVARWKAYEKHLGPLLEALASRS